MTTAANTREVRGHIIFTFAVALALYVAWLIRHELVVLYVSALFAVVLSPVVSATSSLRIGRWRPFRDSGAILFLLLAISGLLVLFFSLAFPPIIRDLQGFSADMPNRLPALVAKLQHIPFADYIDTDDIISKVQDFATRGATYLIVSAKNWASALADIIIGFVLTLYFVLEGDQSYHWVLSFIPRPRRERLDGALQRASVRMGKWLIGQASLMLILGVTSTVAYLSLNIRYAYALGVVAGLLNIVPFLGVAVSIVLAVLVGAIDSWGRVLGVVIFYLIYQPFENYFLVPRIMKSRVDLSALGVLVALLLGSALEGILGAMVAIPTAVLVSELVNEYFVRKSEA